MPFLCGCLGVGGEGDCCIAMACVSCDDIYKYSLSLFRAQLKSGAGLRLFALWWLADWRVLVCVGKRLFPAVQSV